MSAVTSLPSSAVSTASTLGTGTASSTITAASTTPSYSTDYLNQRAGSYPTSACIAFMVACPIFVALRFCARRLNHARWGWDDWLIFPALTSVLLSQSFDMALIQAGGIGRHVAYWELHNSDTVTTWLKLAFAVELLYLLCICLTKLALLSIYLRVLVDKRDRTIAWILVVITLAAWFAQSVACVCQCFPFAFQWDKTIPGGHCFNQQQFYEYLSVSNLITDIVMLLLPFPTIYILQVSNRQKVALALVFFTGSCGFVASILRFVTYFKVDLLSDVTYNSGQLILWTIIEPGMYLISACLPAMRPLLTQILKILRIGSTVTATAAESRRATRAVDRSKDQFGDKTPLATVDGDLELERATGPRMSGRGHGIDRFRSDSATGLPPEVGSVVTHISSAGRMEDEDTEREIVIGSFLNDTPSTRSSDSAEDWALERRRERERDPRLGGIMVTTNVTVR